MEEMDFDIDRRLTFISGDGVRLFVFDALHGFVGELGGFIAIESAARAEREHFGFVIVAGAAVRARDADDRLDPVLVLSRSLPHLDFAIFRERRFERGFCE
jgi:hypothetical protein